MTEQATRIRTTLIVGIVVLAAASGVLHRWWARRADQEAQARYREVRPGMPLSEAERALGMGRRQFLRHPNEVVARVGAAAGARGSRQYSNGGRYGIVLTFDCENQVVCGMALHHLDQSFLERLIQDIKEAVPFKKSTASVL